MRASSMSAKVISTKRKIWGGCNVSSSIFHLSKQVASSMWISILKLSRLADGAMRGWHYAWALSLSLLLLLGLGIQPANAVRLRDLVDIEGVRSNPLIGYGLVVGLDGTGDQTTQVPFTKQSLSNMLSQMGITVPSGTNMQLKNVAAVMVTADFPAFVRAGQNIDVVVSSMGSAKSLRGGTLLMTPLKGADNQVYALAQGNLLVGGAGASSGGSKVQINQLSGGRITNGAVIERELPSTFGTSRTMTLQLKDENFTLAQRISDTINGQNGLGIARALDSRTIELQMPANKSSQVRFIAQI